MARWQPRRVDMGDSWERAGPVGRGLGFPGSPPPALAPAHLHALLFSVSGHWQELETQTLRVGPSPALCAGPGSTPETPQAHNEPRNYSPPRAGPAAPAPSTSPQDGLRLPPGLLARPFRSGLPPGLRAAPLPLCSGTAELRAARGGHLGSFSPDLF